MSKKFLQINHQSVLKQVFFVDIIIQSYMFVAISDSDIQKTGNGQDRSADSSCAAEHPVS